MSYGMNMLLWTSDASGEKFLPLFERLKKMGFDSVEIPIMAPDVKKCADLGKCLESIGLKRTALTVLTPEANLIGRDEKQRQKGVAHLKAVSECCQALGSSLLVGPIYAALGVFTGKGPTTEEWSWAAEGLREAAETAKKFGVTLAAEYLNRFEIYLLNCSADAVRMVRDVGHPNFRMMYDTFHANIEEKSITEALSSCAESLIHVHISENDRSTPGKGAVNWKETFSALKKIHYTGSLTIEAFGLALPELAAATKIWRRMFVDEELLAKEGLSFMKSQWESKQ